MKEINAVAALERSPCFRGINPQVLHAVSMFAGEIQLQAGETLSKRGEPCAAIWLLVSGRIAARDTGGAPTSFEAGALLGLPDLLNARPCSASWVAEIPTAALVFDGAAVSTLSQDARAPGSAFRRAMIISMSDQLLEANRRVSDYLAAHPGAARPSKGVLSDLRGILLGTRDSARRG